MALASALTLLRGAPGSADPLGATDALGGLDVLGAPDAAAGSEWAAVDSRLHCTLAPRRALSKMISGRRSIFTAAS
jgi:hypothetical protein